MADPVSGGVRVKICGVLRQEDARVAAAAGADYVGAVLSPGFGRSVSPEAAARFLEGDAHPPALVGVFVDAEASAVARALGVAGAGVAQLHGEEAPALLRALREEGPWRLWKAVRVAGPDDVRRAFETWAELADGLLLDGSRGGRPGGSGVRFPWEALERLRGSAPAGLELVVAGGLDADNVAEAVARLSPDVVDVSSGVESGPGAKDPEKVRAFLAHAREASGGARAGSRLRPRVREALP